MSAFRNNYLRLALLVTFILFALIIFRAFSYLPSVDHLLVIHFTGMDGIDYSGTKADVYSVILSGLAMAGLNFFFANYFYRRDKFFSYLFAYFNVFLAGLILIALAVIISVN